jgi:renalase
VKIAVIGAGIAGATCAGTLAEAGHVVSVFDKSGRPGGRMATRRIAWHGPDKASHDVRIDHGAQYFTARSAAFRSVVQRGIAEGWIARWDFRLKDAGPSTTERYVAVPGMPSFAAALLAKTEVRFNTRITELAREGLRWTLHAEGATVDGTFDAVIVAIPPAQAAPLVATHVPAWHRALSAIRMLPCWTLLAVTDVVEWPYDAARIHDTENPLTWVARNEFKPGHLDPASGYGYSWWTAQAKPQWTQSNIVATHDEIRPVLESSLARALGCEPGDLHVQHSVTHRWLYSLAAANPQVGAELAWWDVQNRLGVCGDGLGGIGVERAYLSGLSAAQQMLTGYMV